MSEIPFNINQYTNTLTKKEGIFFSKNKSEISYPKDGNDACFTLEENSFWFKHRNNCILSLVDKYGKDKPFFDIGGGNGFVSKELENHGIQTCLIEPGVKGCINAKKRGLKNIVCSDLNNAGFKKGSIPIAGLFDVIEHIENDVDFLRETNHYLMADGILVITAPAYQFLWSKEDEDAGHFRRYNLRNLKKKLNETGFKIIYSTYIFSFLVFPVLFFRTLPSLLGIAERGIEKAEKEHTVDKNGFLNKLLTKLLLFETKQVEKNRKIPLGGSCLIVAKIRK